MTDLISQTLLGYFSMLQSVSDKKLLAYNARELVSSLAEAVISHDVEAITVETDQIIRMASNT